MRQERPGFDLFLVSLLILFLELACIRWFSAHVTFLTFFTNAVLLACFVGMSVGCLVARQPNRQIAATPWLMVIALLAGSAAEAFHGKISAHIDVGNQTAAEMVYFGTEPYKVKDAVVPVELLAGIFFLLIAMLFIGPGQELGRAFDRASAGGTAEDSRPRIWAYTLNIAGSLVGIVLFAACSWLQLPPLVWFTCIVLGMLYFLTRVEMSSLQHLALTFVPLVLVLTLSYVSLGTLLGLTGFKSEDLAPGVQFWSPYYRVEYKDPWIDTNLISHQKMHTREGPFPAYDLPFALRRDAGGAPFRNILIIGAGSGNDVSRALRWCGPDGHIDAVEIDPVIQRIGMLHHPDKPYFDARVTPHLNDGRNFLRNAPAQKYDLVIYALVDSLVLHSGYSNIRLESYLFTRQAFADAKRVLKPDGVFAVYNYFRQGWIVARLQNTLQAEFGELPVIISLPSSEKIDGNQSFNNFTLALAGNKESLEPIRAKFRESPYQISLTQPLTPNSVNGFSGNTNSQDFGVIFPAEVTPPSGSLLQPSDDWPFLYLRSPSVPALTLRGSAMMLFLALAVLIIHALRNPTEVGATPWYRPDGRMFLLGAGFMLIETKAVVQMALLFGSTWMVNTVVFFSVLVMILLANLFVLLLRPQNLVPYYSGLFATLGLNLIVPLDAFLGMERSLQAFLSCSMVFAPVAFAAVIFAVSFARRSATDRAIGWNIAGAMVGGLSENLSMVLGFQYLLFVAAGFYALSVFEPRKLD